MFSNKTNRKIIFSYLFQSIFKSLSMYLFVIKKIMRSDLWIIGVFCISLFSFSFLKKVSSYFSIWLVERQIYRKSSLKSDYIRLYFYKCLILKYFFRNIYLRKVVILKLWTNQNRERSFLLHLKDFDQQRILIKFLPFQRHH